MGYNSNFNLQTMDRLQGTQEQMEPVSKHTVQFSRERVNSIHIFKGVYVAKYIYLRVFVVSPWTINLRKAGLRMKTYIRLIIQNLTLA